MKASIIIPTYRRPKLFRHALRSAARVRFPAEDYEVVVVNDGGAGVNRKLVRRWWPGPQDRIHYVRIPHSGLSAAVNRGLVLARGEYCTILPDDDIILPNKLEILCRFLDEHLEADVVYSLPRYFGALRRGPRVPARLKRFLAAHPILTWKHMQRGDGLWVHGTSTMYRTQVCLDVGGWDTALKTGEEYEFHLRLLKLGHHFYAVNAVTTGYRVHRGNKSARFRKNRRPMRRHIRKKLGRIRR